MPLPYTLSFDAAEDLRTIFAYIAASSGVDRAANILIAIESAFETLAESPSLGRVRYEFNRAPRSWAVLRWVIFYEPIDANEILILRVLDGSRDLSKLLRGLE